MSEPTYRNMNIKLRIKPDNSIEKIQFSEYEEVITITEDGDDKILTITAQIEEVPSGRVL
tara:strand:- start:291 stop:470 length:180 start_codon:yes stop_codon:yes gene_type:complete